MLVTIRILIAALMLAAGLAAAPAGPNLAPAGATSEGPAPTPPGGPDAIVDPGQDQIWGPPDMPPPPPWPLPPCDHFSAQAFWWECFWREMHGRPSQPLPPEFNDVAETLRQKADAALDKMAEEVEKQFINKSPDLILAPRKAVAFFRESIAAAGKDTYKWFVKDQLNTLLGDPFAPPSLEEIECETVDPAIVNRINPVAEDFSKGWKGVMFNLGVTVTPQARLANVTKGLIGVSLVDLRDHAAKGSIRARAIAEKCGIEVPPSGATGWEADVKCWPWCERMRGDQDSSPPADVREALIEAGVEESRADALIAAWPLPPCAAIKSRAAAEELWLDAWNGYIRSVSPTTAETDSPLLAANTAKGHGWTGALAALDAAADDLEWNGTDGATAFRWAAYLSVYGEASTLTEGEVEDALEIIAIILALADPGCLEGSEGQLAATGRLVRFWGDMDATILKNWGLVTYMAGVAKYPHGLKNAPSEAIQQSNFFQSQQCAVKRVFARPMAPPDDWRGPEPAPTRPIDGQRVIYPGFEGWPRPSILQPIEPDPAPAPTTTTARPAPVIRNAGDDGYREGYDDARLDGRSDGIDDGRDGRYGYSYDDGDYVYFGWSHSDEPEFEAGYQAGFESGYLASYQRGYEDASGEAFEVGYAAGFSDRRDGAEEGASYDPVGIDGYEGGYEAGYDQGWADSPDWQLARLSEAEAAARAWGQRIYAEAAARCEAAASQTQNLAEIFELFLPPEGEEPPSEQPAPAPTPKPPKPKPPAPPEDGPDLEALEAAWRAADAAADAAEADAAAAQATADAADAAAETAQAAEDGAAGRRSRAFRTYLAARNAASAADAAAETAQAAEDGAAEQRNQALADHGTAQAVADAAAAAAAAAQAAVEAAAGQSSQAWADYRTAQAAAVIAASKAKNAQAEEARTEAVNNAASGAWHNAAWASQAADDAAEAAEAEEAQTLAAYQAAYAAWSNAAPGEAAAAQAAAWAAYQAWRAAVAASEAADDAASAAQAAEDQAEPVAQAAWAAWRAAVAASEAADAAAEAAAAEKTRRLEAAWDASTVETEARKARQAADAAAEAAEAELARTEAALGPALAAWIADSQASDDADEDRKSRRLNSSQGYI